LRDLSNLGRVLDGVVQDGANSFGGLTFGLSDPQEARDTARELAVKDAMRKAAILAAGAGVGLGPILELSESSSGMPQPMALQEMAFSRAVPVAEGELTISATVQMTFEIAQ
ncbi:MAG: SIMPL domain-containing protein, partial [Paracoccaceae bacterium]|nr:SIMPL domain-containing protein [Paracoccaceae bacterium]